MKSVVALGEPLYEFSRIPGARHYAQGFGGDTSNFSVAAARAGGRAAYLTRIGDDPFGDELMGMWRDEAVDVSAVEVAAGEPTGLYFITHGPQGHVFSYRRTGSAASVMRLTPAFAGAIQRAGYFHVSGISQAISVAACDTVFEAIAMAREHAVPVSYDLNYRPRLWPAARARAIAEATIGMTDLFLPSLDEASALLGIDDADALIDWSHARGARLVAVKAGARGAVVSDGRTRVQIPGHRVVALDATGAGDCFAGVLVTRLVAGDPLAQAARAACVAAALSTTGYGALSALPTWPQILAAMNVTA
ncbi:MAG TPA: sugar kinase [Burkholderiaceae bacterium]|nr:sugar kinase [Burkholderiaceae bacterium]